MVIDKSYKWSFICAILLHVVVLVFLSIKFTAHHSFSVTQRQAPIIQAVAVNKSQVDRQIAQIHAEKRRVQTAERERQAVERERLAKIQAEKVWQQKAKQWALRQKEEQALAQRKAKAQADMERAMQQQMAHEQQQLSIEAQQAQTEIDKYKALILQAIAQYWIAPPHLPEGIQCKLLVHVAPGGAVLSIDVIQPSGNAALDRSAKIAVLKASPLPVPQDAGLFDNFRIIRLTAKPSGVY